MAILGSNSLSFVASRTHPVSNRKDFGSPLFVALEGIDGAGKTTVLREIGKRAADQGLPILALEKKSRTHPDPIVQRQLVGLHDLLWADWEADPFLTMGPLHWAHLMAGWFATLQRAFIEPALDASKTVVVDTWIYKFIARLQSKQLIPDANILTIFESIARPDVVVRLNISPQLALRRKARLTLGESGNPTSGQPNDLDFLAHQSDLGARLDAFGRAEGWSAIDVNDLSVSEVADALCELLSRPPSDRMEGAHRTGWVR
jgi:thymidylate kinase